MMSIRHKYWLTEKLYDALVGANAQLNWGDNAPLSSTNPFRALAKGERCMLFPRFPTLREDGRKVRLGFWREHDIRLSDWNLGMRTTARYSRRPIRLSDYLPPTPAALDF